MPFKHLTILTLGFLFSILNLSAQYRSGYVITNTSDTIFGDINAALSNSKQCFFRDEHKNVSKYSPQQLKEFIIIKKAKYSSIQIDSTRLFANVIVEGNLSALLITDNMQNRYFVELKDKDIIELDPSSKPIYIGKEFVADAEEYYYVDKMITKSSSQIKEGNEAPLTELYKHQLLRYVTADKVYAQKVDMAYDLGVKTLIRLTKAYNELNTNDKDVAAASPKSTQKDNIGINYKAQNSIFASLSYGNTSIGYFNAINLKDNKSFSAEVDIQLFNRSKNFFFTTGLNYVSANEDQQPTYKRYYHEQNIYSIEYYTNVSLYRLPLGLKYMYTNKYIKPSVAIGLNLYGKKSESKFDFEEEVFPFLSINLAVRLYRNIHVFYGYMSDAKFEADSFIDNWGNVTKNNKFGLLIQLQ